MANAPAVLPAGIDGTTLVHLWRDNRLWQTLNQYQLVACREANGRQASPIARIMDTQSVITTESGGPCSAACRCAGKARPGEYWPENKGRKRHILSNIETNPVQAAPLLLAKMVSPFPWLRDVFADGGYAGDRPRDALRKIGERAVEIIKRSDVAKGFVVLPSRWVVERTLAWLNRNRRLAKDCEQTSKSATAWLFAASVQLLIRDIAKSCNYIG